MPWPFACASCKSRNVQAGAHDIQFLDCHRLTDANGVIVPLLVQFTNANKDNN